MREFAKPEGFVAGGPKCRVAVIWIDWYAYHFARFAGLQAALGRKGEVRGIELVGGVGVHEGMTFREGIPQGLPVETLMPDCGWKEASKFELAWKLWRKLDALDPGVVLVPGYYTIPALATALWAKLHGRPSVLMTESTADDHARVPWREWLKGGVLRMLFDWAVTGGSAHVRYLRQLGFSLNRVLRFYDVVDNEALRVRSEGLRRRCASSLGLPETYFLYVGRLAPEKNVGGLLRAWAAYRAEGGTWALVIVGDGSECAALKAAASRLSAAAEVHFAGHTRSDELPPFYAFAGCFVLPSRREPWGLVVNEAMACSLPVLVSSRCGCAEDLVSEGDNGFTFEPEDEASLTRYLHRIGELPMEARAAMGRASAAQIRDYSPLNFGREIAFLADLSEPENESELPQRLRAA